MRLPESNELPVNLLSACFNNKSTTYKYYWLLSILQEVEIGKSSLDKQHLFARMISNAWYTVNYFHVSFGKQDLIQDTIRKINSLETITIDENLDSVCQKLILTKNTETRRLLRHFDKNVPHWFLSPWFPGMRRAEIYNTSKKFSENCLYAIHDERIEINPAWKNYLISNARVLKDFCFWNLSLYLQSKNPNVPDIPNKIIKPARRNSLTQQRTNFWDLVVNDLGYVKCIYTDNILTIGNYAIEHFIPHNFVSHDLIWNLIPADKLFNSTKSDKLPPIEIYFDKFFKLQESAINIVSKKYPNNKFLQDYLTIFQDLSDITQDKFKERIQPLITIASNNGFEFFI